MVSLRIGRGDGGTFDPVTGEPLNPEHQPGTDAAWSAGAVEGCPSCGVRGGPRHHGSPRCESGGEPHCACDRCF